LNLAVAHPSKPRLLTITKLYLKKRSKQMTNNKVNENTNGAELIAHEEEANARRQVLKQIGLAAGALAVTTVGSSAALADSSNLSRELDPAEPVGSADQSKDVQERIIVRALTDEKYRARLIADPRRVISEEIGRPVPRDVQITVLQDSPNAFHVVLPYMPPMGQGDRLSKRDLNDSAYALAVAKSRKSCKCSSLSVCHTK
jgi:hypothetical protein